MKITLDKWLSESKEHQHLYAEEGLILEATEEIWAALERTGKTKADLARLLGTSKANITQLLNGGRNLTLRTLADIAFALGQTARIRITEAGEYASGWEVIQSMMKPPQRGISSMLDIAANQEWVTDPTPLRVIAR